MFFKENFFCSKSAFLSGTVSISYNIRRLLKLVYKVKGYTLEYNLHSKRILFSLSLSAQNIQLPVYLLPSLLDPSDKHAFMHT